MSTSKMNYYSIPDTIMSNIQYYCEGDALSDNILKSELVLLNTLPIDKIHTNEDNVIERFLEIFQNAFKDLHGESFDDEGGLEDRDNLYEIIEALINRNQAIRDITYDVLKRREDCCY